MSHLLASHLRKQGFSETVVSAQRSWTEPHCICEEGGPDMPACPFHGNSIHARLHKAREQLLALEREISSMLEEVKP